MDHILKLKLFKMSTDILSTSIIIEKVRNVCRSYNVLVHAQARQLLDFTKVAKPHKRKAKFVHK